MWDGGKIKEVMVVSPCVLDVFRGLIDEACSELDALQLPGTTRLVQVHDMCTYMYNTTVLQMYLMKVFTYINVVIIIYKLWPQLKQAKNSQPNLFHQVYFAV